MFFDPLWVDDRIQVQTGLGRLTDTDANILWLSHPCQGRFQNLYSSALLLAARYGLLPPQHARAYHTCQVGPFRRVYLRSSPNTCIACRGTYPDTCIARGRLEHPVDESCHARVGV